MIHKSSTIFLHWLHWGDVYWLGLLVISIGCINLCHHPAEGRSLLGWHLLVRQLNVPLLLRLQPPIHGIANVNGWWTFGFSRHFLVNGAPLTWCHDFRFNVTLIKCLINGIAARNSWQGTDSTVDNESECQLAQCHCHAGIKKCSCNPFQVVMTTFLLPNREKRNDAIFDVAVELIICHPSLLVHPNRCGKDPFLLKTKPPAHALDMRQKINSDSLPFHLSRTRWELPVRRHAFRRCVATKNPSAHQQRLGKQPVCQLEGHPHFASIKKKISVSLTLMICQGLY